MTQIIPATYCFNHEHIHFVPDLSYNIPSVGDKVIIKERTFEVLERKFMPLMKGKRQCFIDFKFKSCVMTIENIKESISNIESMAGDNEVQHMAEKKLLVSFIEFCRDGITTHNCEDIPELAKEVLKVQDVEFERWCA